LLLAYKIALKQIFVSFIHAQPFYHPGCDIPAAPADLSFCKSRTFCVFGVFRGLIISTAAIFPEKGETLSRLFIVLKVS
jgi:hypothetical protein